MSRRERVGGVAGASTTQPVTLQSPWGAPATPAAPPIAEQHNQHAATEVAAFVASPSPTLDSPTTNIQSDQTEGKFHDGAQAVQAPAADNGPAAQQASLQPADDSQELARERAKELKLSKDVPLLSKQQRSKSEVHQARHKHKKGTADIHLIGEITGAVGFGSEALYCTWQLVYDAQLWSVCMGQDKGRTHASCPLLPEDGGLSGVVWECPIDVVLTTTSMQHWPVIVFKLFHRSVWLGSDEFVGYSVCTLPNTPGCHHVSCPVWAAVESHRSFKQHLISWFTGLTPQLVNESFITDLEQRYEQGQHLHTQDSSSTTFSLKSITSMHIPSATPTALSVERISSSNTASALAAGGRCRSFSNTFGAGSCSSVTGAGSLAGAGGRICLRLHLLARGLDELKLAGGESVSACLERLRDNVEKLRRHKGPESVQEEEEESEGIRLVREGRAARLAAVQQQLDGASNRDQLQTSRDSNISSGYGTDGYSGSRGKSSLTASRASPDRMSPVGRNALRFAGRESQNSGREAEVVASPNGSNSPARFSRAGRLASSPNRAAASLLSDDDPPTTTTAAQLDSTRRAGSPNLMQGWRRSTAEREAAVTAGDVAGNAGRFDSPASRDNNSPGWRRSRGDQPYNSGTAAAAEVSSSPSRDARLSSGSRQPGQYAGASARLVGRGAAAVAGSPTEQQRLWSGDRSAPGESVAADSARGGAEPGGGASRSALLLRRGAQLEPLLPSGTDRSVE